MRTKYMDKVGFPDLMQFTKQHLRKFETSLLKEVKLIAHKGKSLYSGILHLPHKPTKKSKGRGDFGIRVSINVKERYTFPYTDNIEIGSETLPNRRWRYIWEDLTYLKLEDAAAFVMGHEIFHFLIYSKPRQIPGRKGEPAANVYGIDFYNEFGAHRATYPEQYAHGEIQ